MKPDLTQDYSIGEESFAFIASLAKSSGASKMLEFGSGASTVRWALEFPRLVVFSIEHDTEYYRHTCEMIRNYELESRVFVFHAPLAFRLFCGRPFFTYDFPRLDCAFDFVVIDGPPYPTRRGREACLHFIQPLLRSGATVILDDYNRTDEMRIVTNWESTYREMFTYDYSKVGHGLAVLRRTALEGSPQFSLDSVLDSYRTMAQLFRSKEFWHLRQQVRPN